MILWAISETSASAEERFLLSTATPPRFLVENRGEMLDYYEALLVDNPSLDYQELEALEMEMPILPRLMMTEPAFTPNYMHEGLVYVSGALRAAMSLPDDAVDYRPVDLTKCCESARAKAYMTLEVVHSAEPFDREQSDGVWVDAVGRDGRSSRRWELIGGGPNDPTPRIVFSGEFVPPAPLFRALGTGWLMATDDLAQRVMHAGISDVMFIKRDGERGRTEMVCKTLS